MLCHQYGDTDSGCTTSELQDIERSVTGAEYRKRVMSLKYTKEDEVKSAI